MEYIYHAVPKNLDGSILYPLFSLKDKFPDQYEKEIKRIILRYEYKEVEENRFSQTHSVKKLKERNIITPPVAKPDAYYIKNISLSESDYKKIVKYELSMNFTNESNLLFSNLEDNTNKLVFKKEFFLHSQKEKRANIAQ